MKSIGVLLLLILIFVSMVPLTAQDDESDVPIEWPEQYYAPYIYPTYTLVTTFEQTGVRYFSLAFILNGVTDCQARWQGAAAIDQFFFLNDLKELREAGGDIIVSFGGWGGDELAMTCPDLESLTAEYQRVIDTLEITHLDFDIEGDDIDHPESIERRSQAIAALQAANEGLVISFTLPVYPTGLKDSGIALLESAIEHGVTIDVVNIMTMNFGDKFPSGTMGEKTIQAAESLFEQLKMLYPDASEEELWGMIGLTPMIGVNNIVEEVFTLEDAEKVTAFALERGIRSIGMWAMERDRTCQGGRQVLMPDCSGVEQDDYGFSSIFNALTTQHADE